MPEELSRDLFLFLMYLLPGFLAAWIFYGLTSHPKPSQFERVVQALIFTFIIQTINPIFGWMFTKLGSIIVLGDWDENAIKFTSLVLAVTFGGVLAYLTNNDYCHKYLRKHGFTSRTSHPSEWFYVFSEKVTFVILNFHDGRRLYGWPKEWPIDGSKGQFYIMLPSWIDIDGNIVDLPQLDGVLVSASDVKWVEFLK